VLIHTPGRRRLKRERAGRARLARRHFRLAPQIFASSVDFRQKARPSLAGTLRRAVSKNTPFYAQTPEQEFR
jgi:hypothetical protein